MYLKYYLILIINLLINLFLLFINYSFSSSFNFTKNCLITKLNRTTNNLIKLECNSLNELINYNNNISIDLFKLNCFYLKEYNQTFINKIIKKIQNKKEISYLSINNKCPNNLIFNLSTLPKLEKLNLSGNNLNYFNWQQINSTKLSLIDFRNNPLNCENCKNAWIKKTKNKKIINGWHFKILFPTIPQFIYSPISLQKCSFSNCLNETAKFEEKNNLKINLGDQLELKCFFKSNNQNISSLINLNKIFIWPFNGKEIEKENNLKTKIIYLQKENSVILKINSLNIFHLGPVICRCLHCLIPGIFDFKELRFPVPLNIYIYENEIKGEKKIILRGYPIGPLIYLKIIRKEDNKTNLIEFNENIKENESNNIYLLFNNSLIIKQENDHSSYFIRYFTISIHECTECKHSQKGGIYDLNFCILNNNNNCKLINNLNIIPPKHLISNNNNNNIKNNFKQNTSLSILNIFLSIPPILIIISILTICGRIIWKFKQRIKIREKLKRRTRRGSRNTQRTEETSIPLDTMSRTLSLSNYIQNQLNLPLIPEEELQLNECIGKGAFAEVYIGIWKKLKENIEENQQKINENKVAIKMLINIKIDEEMEREAALLANLEHPNVLKMFGVSQWRGQVALILELMNLGDLRKPCCTSYTQFPPPLLHNELINICIQIVEGLYYLFIQQIVHRDLAARNCLVSGESDMRCSSASFRPSINVKIGDFGMSRRLYTSSDYYKMQDKRNALPVRWMAPECLSNGKFTSQSDIWSLGILLFEIFSFGLKPFTPLEDNEVIIAVLSGMRPKVPDKCKPELADLMKECWHRNPQKRISVLEVLQRLKNFQNEETENKKENNGILIN